MRVKIIYSDRTYNILDCDTIIDEEVIKFIKQQNKQVNSMVILDDYKICTVCNRKVHKSNFEEHFYKRKATIGKGTVDGYYSKCKKCYLELKKPNKTEYNKTYWEKNKDKINEQRRLRKQNLI